MKINPKMEEAINNQINRELYSGYLYLAMSAYFENENLEGFANWMRKQAKEEQEHAMKFYKYIIERGGKVTLKEIEAPKNEWDSAAEVFEQTYNHEKEVTKLIETLMDLAVSEKDYATQSMLKWFIEEQVEEESTAEGILEKLNMVKQNPNALLMLDKSLAQRE